MNAGDLKTANVNFYWIRWTCNNVEWLHSRFTMRLLISICQKIVEQVWDCAFQMLSNIKKQSFAANIISLLSWKWAML